MLCCEGVDAEVQRATGARRAASALCATGNRSAADRARIGGSVHAAHSTARRPPAARLRPRPSRGSNTSLLLQVFIERDLISIFENNNLVLKFIKIRFLV